MILPDNVIKQEIEDGNIGIEPFNCDLVQPASVDLRLDSSFLLFNNNATPVIDVAQDHRDRTYMVEVPKNKTFILHPGQFALGATIEKIRLPGDIMAKLEGKSSLGRLGLLIHITAGLIDPGFEGHLTLELSNVAQLPIMLYPSMPVGQLIFMRMEESVETPYGSEKLGSKYSGQRGPTPSRYFENFNQGKLPFN